jgi:hypothetical protein
MSVDARAVEPEPPLAAAAQWLKDRTWIAAWWLGGRALVFATALVIHVVGVRGYSPSAARRHAFGLLTGWDGLWYRRVAADGYLLIPGRQSDPAFFPLYPMLLRGAHALGLAYLTAGLVISNLALLAALVGFEALTRGLFGSTFARRATTYVAVFPLGYVFSMAYPESIVLGAIALAALAALRARWATAATFAAAAALARPEGVLVALPLLAIAWQSRDRLSPLARGVALGAVVAPIAALASYPTYLGSVLHDPLAWNEAERAWGRRFSPLGFADTITRLPHVLSANAWLARDVICFVVYLALLVAARRAGTSWPWLIGAVAVVTVPLFSGSFESIGRFGLLALPVFWGLAWVGRNALADKAIQVVSAVLLVALTATIPFVFP